MHGEICGLFLRCCYAHGLCGRGDKLLCDGLRKAASYDAQESDLMLMK